MRNHLASLVAYAKGWTSNRARSCVNQPDSITTHLACWPAAADLLLLISYSPFFLVGCVAAQLREQQSVAWHAARVCQQSIKGIFSFQNKHHTGHREDRQCTLSSPHWARVGCTQALSPRGDASMQQDAVADRLMSRGHLKYCERHSNMLLHAFLAAVSEGGLSRLLSVGEVRAGLCGGWCLIACGLSQ